MDIELTGENEKNKLRFVDNYGDIYEVEVIYNINTKELRFRSDYTVSELYMPISFFNEIINTFNITNLMEVKS